MKNKHLFILVFLIIVLALVLPSCGGSKSATTSTKTAAVTTTASAKTTSPTSSSTKTTSPATTTTAAGGSLSDILGKGADISTISYDMSMTVAGQNIITKVYQKNQKIREDMTMSGMTFIIIFNMDENVMYMYYPDQKMAMKQALDPSQIPQGSTEDTDAILNYNPTVVGTETIDGKVCTVITYDMPGEGSVKTWIWNDKGFPLRMEMNTSAGNTTIEFTNVDFSDIPDSMFQLPSDVTIQDMGG
jgi:hypothetical protein